jgi:trimeric autotransporter adhesin
MPPGQAVNQNWNKATLSDYMRLRFFSICTAIISFFAVHPLSLTAQGTAFTYQGRLNANGSPASGTYNLVFSLYTTNTAGAVVAGPVTNNTVVVTNGLFTVAIDFGSAPWNGETNWLQIGVESNGITPFTALSPRQQLTPTPYAIFAESISGLVVQGDTNGSPNLIGGSSLNYVSSGIIGATIGGGGAVNFQGVSYSNSVTGDFGTVGGGAGNVAGAPGAVVGGGGFDGSSFQGNQATGNASTVAGGQNNSAQGNYSFVGGGIDNVASGQSSTVAGGGQTAILSDAKTFPASGGVTPEGNSASGDFSAVGGGYENSASAVETVVAGGDNNVANNQAAAVLGGENNSATEDHTTVGGGGGNSAGGSYAFVGGGQGNNGGGAGDTIVGGFNNSSGGGNNSTIVGGANNNSSGSDAFIGAGGNNSVSGVYATIGGGSFNSALADLSFVGGGSNNLSDGFAAMIPGGINNSALGIYSFAAGNNAQATNDGAFVWSDSTGTTTTSFTNNQFMARASGGVVFLTGTAASPTSYATGSAGVALLPGATAWSTVSDRNAKKNFEQVDTVAVLDKLAAVPIQQWNYKWEKDSDVPNIGPMAQDFKHAFYPGRDDKSISTLEFDGVELAAIQGLNEKLEAQAKEKDAEITDLKQQNDQLAKQLNDLASAVKMLERKNQDTK